MGACKGSYSGRFPLLQYASAELRADRDFVLAAVSHCGHAFEYAATELKADREFVLAAAAQDDYCWNALECVSARARKFVRTHWWNVGRGPLGWPEHILAKDMRED